MNTSEQTSSNVRPRTGNTHYVAVLNHRASAPSLCMIVCVRACVPVRV